MHTDTYIQMPTHIQMNVKRKELGKQITLSLGPWPDFPFHMGIWCRVYFYDWNSICNFNIQRIFIEHVPWVSLLRCSWNSRFKKKMGKILSPFNSHWSWRSAVKKVKQNDTLSVLVSLAKALLPANPLKAYWSAIISLISLSYCYKAKFDKATLAQMLQPITFRM